MLTAVPCASKQDQNFTGWFYDGDCTEPFHSEDPFEENTVLYAAYEEPEQGVTKQDTAYVADCDAKEPIVIRSEEEITDENWMDYLEIDSALGDLPTSFHVTALEDNQYEVTPEQDYQAGFTYDFHAKNGATLISGESEDLNTVTQRIHKDNVEEVVLKKEIVYLDWDDVVREGETYQFYIPKRAEFVITEKTPICFLNGYNEWVAAGKNPNTFGDLYDDDTLFVSVNLVNDQFLVKESDKGTLSGKDWYFVTVENADLADIIDDVDVYMEENVEAEDLIDTEQIEQNILAGDGINQLEDLLTCAILDDETFQNPLFPARQLPDAGSAQGNELRKPPFQVFPLQPEIAERAFQPQPSGNERMLRKVANLLFGKPSVPFPVDAHRAESRFQRPRQNLHQTAFSASVAPEHSRHAACFDEQVNTRENAPFAERQLCGVDFENMFFSGRHAAGRRNSSAKDSITRNPPRSLRPAVFGGGCRGCGNSRIHRNSAG